jgi:hypothetical protein
MDILIIHIANEGCDNVVIPGVALKKVATPLRHVITLKEQQIHLRGRRPAAILLHKDLHGLLVDCGIDEVGEIVDDSIDFPHGNYLLGFFLLDIFQFRNTESSPFPDYGEHG